MCLQHETAVIGCSKSFKVIDFVTNGKPICHFLLVNNSNCGPVLYRLGDIAKHVENCRLSAHRSHLMPPPLRQWGWPLVGIKLESMVYIFVADSTSLASFGNMLLTLEKCNTVKNDTKLQDTSGWPQDDHITGYNRKPLDVTQSWD